MFTQIYICYEDAELSALYTVFILSHVNELGIVCNKLGLLHQRDAWRIRSTFWLLARAFESFGGHILAPEILLISFSKSVQGIV